MKELDHLMVLSNKICITIWIRLTQTLSIKNIKKLITAEGILVLTPSTFLPVELHCFDLD